MGEVYQAHDLKLQRQVALKILPDSFAYDPERLARFDREAKLLASLNHPNIAAIYGLEEAGGTRLPGAGARGRRDAGTAHRRGPLPVEEAVEVCRQIAEGLETAHEKGVIHRDLKPANVQITRGRQGQDSGLRPGAGVHAGPGVGSGSSALPDDHRSDDRGPEWCWGRLLI